MEKTIWKNLRVNIQNIKHETAKAVLIQLPKSDWTFWHPKKLVRNGSHSYEVTIGYTDEFKFNCKRTSKRTWNVLDERVFSVEEIQRAFAGTNPEFGED